MDIFLEINKNVWIYLNNFVIENSIEKYVIIFSDGPIFFLPVFLLWYRIFYTYKDKNDEKKSDLLKIFYATILAIIINLIIKYFFHLDRPESILKPIIEHIPDASFPSDHAAVSFAFLFAILFTGYKKTFWILLPFFIIMNLSRLAWGIHWFFDIIIWILIWIISAIIMIFILNKNKYINGFNKKVIKTFKKIKF